MAETCCEAYARAHAATGAPVCGYCGKAIVAAPVAPVPATKPATWIDPEERAYPEGSLRQSRRRFVARADNGALVRGVCGVPDTYFSIPARATYKGRTIAGFITTADDGSREVRFRAYTYRKNGALLDKVAE